MSTNRVISWTAQMHRHQGNLALADGSVQQYSSARLQQSATNALAVFAASNNAPFRLLIP
jgi:prepilin-type processing-associated H-X9-DG protein